MVYVMPLSRRACSTVRLAVVSAHSIAWLPEYGERSTGRKFALEHVPEGVLELQHGSARDPLEQSFGALMLGYARGDVVDMSQTLDAFPLQLTSVREFADATSRRSTPLTMQNA